MRWLRHVEVGAIASKDDRLTNNLEQSAIAVAFLNLSEHLRHEALFLPALRAHRTRPRLRPNPLRHLHATARLGQGELLAVAGAHQWNRSRFDGCTKSRTGHSRGRCSIRPSSWYCSTLICRYSSN